MSGKLGNLKRHAILVCIAIAISVANGVLYQLNVMFLLYTVIGVFMGINIQPNEGKA